MIHSQDLPPKSLLYTLREKARSVDPVKILLLMISALLWICMLRFPSYSGGTDLDSSWRLAYAYFLNHHMAAGVDYIFTYGPLGYLNSSLYDSNLFWIVFFWELILDGIFVWYFYLALQRSTNPLIKIISLVLLLLFLPPLQSTVHYLAFLTLIGINLMENGKSLRHGILDALLLSVISMGKFVFFAYAIVLVVFCEYAHRKRQPRSVLSPAVLFIISFCFVWILLRQPLLNIPVYLHSSIQIALGYNDAMPLTHDLSEVFLGVPLLFLVSACAAASMLGTPTAVPLFLMLQAGLLLIWKQGFTRQDTHTATFFGYILFFSLLLPGYFTFSPLRCRRSLISAGVAVAILGSILGLSNSPWFSFVRTAGANIFTGLVSTDIYRIRNNLRIIASPHKSLYELQERQKNQKKHQSLPLIRARVGQSSIDVISYEQGAVLLSDLHYQPRPVFQGYSAYTPYLEQRNADFFRSPSAPPYVLFKLQTIDGKMPSQDDNPALLEVLRRYVPVATERSYLLLQRQNASPVTREGKVTRSQQIRFMQPIEISKEGAPYQTLELHFEETLPGRIRKFFYKPSLIFLRIETQSGMKIQYRLIPGISLQPFLLNPLLQDTGDVLQLYSPQRGGTRVKCFTLITESPGRWFRDKIEMKIRKVPDPAGGNLQSQAAIDCVRDFLEFGLQSQSFKELNPVFVRVTEGARAWNGDFALFAQSRIKGESGLLAKGGHKLIIFGYEAQKGEKLAKVKVKINGNDYILSLGRQDAYTLVFSLPQPQTASVLLQLSRENGINNQSVKAFIKSMYVE